MRLFHLSPAAHPPKKFVLGRGIVPGIDHGNAIQGNLLNTLKAKTPRSFRQISPMGLSGLGDGRTSVVIFGGGERRVARNTTIYLILKSRTLGWSTEVSRPFKQPKNKPSHQCWSSKSLEYDQKRKDHEITLEHPPLLLEHAWKSCSQLESFGVITIFCYGYRTLWRFVLFPKSTSH